MFLSFILIFIGFCCGSFINAFVWRWHEHKNWVKDRSECVHCHHKLGVLDLIPVISWITLRGRCRYCGKSISAQYPIVELVTALLFIISYIYWPYRFSGVYIVEFMLWLIILLGLIILALYDLKWMLLPNKIVAAFSVPAMFLALLSIVFSSSNHLSMVLEYTGGILVGGGVFYVIYVLSKGKMIGGGDVKLGFLLGLIAGTIAKSFLMIFLAALIGSVVAIFLMIMSKANRKSKIPFGPFLIAGLFMVQLFGVGILNWYMRSLLGV